MKKLTRQEIFTKAYLGLKGQDWARITGLTGTCVYTDHSGRHCAIGHVFEVPTDLQNDGINSPGFRGFFRDNGYDFSQDDIDWMKSLQLQHDNADGYHGMRDNMEHFARQSGLEIPE